MTDQQQDNPSRGTGGCVAVVTAAVALSVPFAVAPDAGVLTVWGAGGAVVWWAVRRRTMSVSSATPPPLSGTPSGDVFADETDEIDRVEWGPEGVVCIVHPRRIEINQR
jgi:hypothetical protein